MNFNNIKIDDQRFNVEMFFNAAVMPKFTKLYGATHCKCIFGDTHVSIHIELNKNNMEYVPPFNDVFVVEINKNTSIIDNHGFWRIGYSYYHIEFINETLKIFEILNSCGFKTNNTLHYVICDVTRDADYLIMQKHKKYTFLCQDLRGHFTEIPEEDRKQQKNVRLITPEYYANRNRTLVAPCVVASNIVWQCIEKSLNFKQKYLAFNERTIIDEKWNLCFHYGIKHDGF